jgi:threonine aldolase
MTATDELYRSELAALRDQCSVFLAGHGPVNAARLLADIPGDTAVDRYGDGGVVAELEAEIAGLLDKPAAAFLPSGTMAQQSVLRVHADRRQRQTVIFHPMCHLHQHEGQAFQRLHGLTGRPAGDPNRLMSIDDLTAVAEPPAALLIELPQRDLGGQQPDWADLQAQTDWARGRGAAVHLDGARLWESSAGYGRPLGQIAGLFDTVYVSFYKGLGALAGCCLAGPADILAEVREWRHRMGGTLFGLWPNAASALNCLRRRLPLMPEYLSHAREIAVALRDLAGVRVVPDPPQVPMMHLLLSTTPERFAAAARRLAVEQQIWTWPTAVPTGDPAVQRLELSVGDATGALSAAQVRDIIAALIARLRDSPAKNGPDQRDGMVRDEYGDGQRHGRIQPVPAAGDQDDRARRGHSGRGRGICDGVQQDGRHGQVSLLAVVVRAQDQGPRRHHQRGDTARHQHRQAVYRRRAGNQPVNRHTHHDEFERQQPSGVDQRDGSRRAQAPAACSPGRESDRQQGQGRACRVEKIVTALGQHPERMRADPHRDQAGDQGQVEHEHHRQALHPGHLPQPTVATAIERACYPSAIACFAVFAAACGIGAG